MAEISEFFKVTTRILAGGVPRQVFGQGLILTTDDTLAAGGSGKAKKFTSIQDVGDTLDEATEPYKAAAAWFAQDPAPQNLYIGRWATEDVATTLRGGTPAALTALAAANSTFNLNGTNFTVDLSSASTYAEVATAVQTQIANTITGATFVHNTTAFLLTLADASAITDGVFKPHSGGTGTDISAALGMAAASNPTYKQGSDAELIAGAINAVLAVIPDDVTIVMVDNGVPASVTVSSTTEQTYDALAAAAEASQLFAFLPERSDAALVANETASLAARIFALQNNRTPVVYDAAAGGHKAVSAAALYSAQDFNVPASIITGFGKTLPGQAADIIGTTGLAELNRKRTNWYTYVGGLPTFGEGWSPKAGTWIDARYWLDWMANELELAAFNAARASRRLTVAQLYAALDEAMQKGVRSGGIGVGRTVSAAMKADIIQTTGNNAFDGVLTDGYLIHIGRLADQPQVDIDNRMSPPVKVFAAGSEAIHRASIDLLFTN